MERDVSINLRHPRLRVNRSMLAAVIKTLDEHADRFKGGCPAGELSIALMTDAGIGKIHGDFMNDPSATDVVTFEGDPTFGTAGEICVSVDTALSFSKKHGKDFSTELTLYVAHGWLHLAGFDDLQPMLKRSMRRAEARAIRFLAEKKLLSAFTLKPASRKRAARTA